MKSIFALKVFCVAALSFFPITAKAEMNIVSLDLNDAKALIQTGKDAAIQRKVNICIAVVDPSGSLIAFERMDKAALSCANVAIAKARSAALYRTRTSIDMQRVNGEEKAILKLPDIMPIGGGIPIMDNDLVVGAIGVNGAITSLEVKIAEAVASSYKKTPVQSDDK